MPKKKQKTKFPTKLTKSFSSFVKKSSKKTKILISIGVFLLCIPSLFYINQTVQLAFFTPKVVPVPGKLPAPVHIDIPDVDMHLLVEQTAISHGFWGISQNGASYLSISARPGENGPIILYGHNTNDRFGPIRWLSAGKNIVVTTADNKTHTYTIKKTLDVSPQQMDVLTKPKKETLILYTCDGFADLQRFVVIATPSSTTY